MKARMVMIALSALLVMTGCADFWLRLIESVDDEDYEPLIGTWLVTDQSDGWNDHQYIFAEDRSFEITTVTEDVESTRYTGEVVAMDYLNIVVEKITSTNPGDGKRLTLYYRHRTISYDDLYLSWEDDQGTTHYWFLERQ